MPFGALHRGEEDLPTTAVLLSRRVGALGRPESVGTCRLHARVPVVPQAPLPQDVAPFCYLGDMETG